MSASAAQAWAFYREVAKTRELWTLRDDGGYPAPKTRTGQRAMPFWSSRTRVQRIITNVPAYAGFSPDMVTWERFCEYWVPRLAKDGQLIGVNWSGRSATGYDLAPSRAQANVQALIDNPAASPHSAGQA